MHEQVLAPQPVPERIERHAAQQVEQVGFARGVELHQTHARLIAEKVVGLGVDGHLRGAVERGEQGVEFPGE